jgi:hypothetical protein
MPFKPKFPEACRRLDLDLVRRTLARRRLDICAAAKELGVSPADLRRLTWHDPKLLDGAREAIDLYVAHCWGLMIEDLNSPNRRKRQRAVDQILASPLAAGHPLATAPKPKSKSTKPPSKFILEMRAKRLPPAAR